MKVLKSRRAESQWVANSKGKRLTPKYSTITPYEFGTFYVAYCHDYYDAKNIKPDRIFIFNTKSETKLELDNVVEYRKINKTICALNIGGEWHFYDNNMNLLKKGVTSIYRCDNYPYIIVTVDDACYFCNHNLEMVAGPFYSAGDFGPFGHAMVALEENKTVKRTVLSCVDGKLVLKPWSIECDSLAAFSNGFFEVGKNGAFGVIDSDGKEILPPIYRCITPKKHHFILQYNGKYGLADTTGKIIFECFYDEIIETPDKFAVKDFTRLETSKTLEILKQN